MRLYAGSSSRFIELNDNNQMADLLQAEFLLQFGYHPSRNEMMSWRNSLLRVANLLDKANLHDNGVFVEYQLPLSSKRIDLIVTGRDKEGNKNAVLVELKQWEKCQLCDSESDKVITWVGGGNREVLHPSVQVGNYKYYLQGNCSAFYEEKNPVHLCACCFLHNYTKKENDPIFDDRFENALSRFPVYTVDETSLFRKFLEDRLSFGEGMDILAEIENSKLRPSKKLLKEVSTHIKDKLKNKETFKIIGQHKTENDYILLDEQLVVYDKVMSLVKGGLSQRFQYVIIVKGGAGTGKSVIGLQLLADLAALGYHVNYATGSGAFTKTIKKLVGKENDGIINYFLSYGGADPRELDVLILDEAHRIREKTSVRYKKSTGLPQIVELIRAASVTLFFIDDYQVVRKGEIGSARYIKEQAELMGCKVFEYELESQFRCGGSDGYANWINNTLQIKRTANAFWKNESTFKFKIFESPEKLEKAIHEKNQEGFSARLTAGFCWEWSKELEDDHSLKLDVQIDEFKRAWNARPEFVGMKKGIPKSDYWAYEDGGIDQIGCIYTAQGFEFDYVGVIFGEDLKYDPVTSEWKGFPEKSFDGAVKTSEHFLQLVKNTYRVLLTRGMKGCYVYFMDKETERFFKSRMEKE